MFSSRSTPGRAATCQRPARRIGVLRAASLTALMLAVLAGLVLPRAVRADWAKGGALPGLGNGRIWSVAVSPSSAQLILAGTDAGLYRSDDGGQKWMLVGAQGKRVWTVGFWTRPSGPAIAFAGVRSGGVERSDDNGQSWYDINTGLFNHNVRVLAIGAQAVVAGTDDGVAVTLDGTNWRDAGLAGRQISALVVSTNAPQITVIAGTDGGGAGGSTYLFRNAGLGATWEPLTNGLPTTGVVNSLAAGPLPQNAAAHPLMVATDKGTYRSLDAGTTWSESQLPPLTPGGSDKPPITVVAFSPHDPNLVYAGSDMGGSSGGAMLRSTDQGGSFTTFDKGLPDQQKDVVGLTVLGTAPPWVIVGIVSSQGGGVYFQQDNAAPPAAAIVPEAQAAAPALAPLSPRPPTPPPAASAVSGSSEGGGGPLHFPFPLLLELVLAGALASVFFRWRRQKMEVEGPP